MRWSEIIDAEEVARTIALFKPDGQLFECRILGSSKRNIISGYFTDARTLIESFDKVDLRGQNIYFTLNALNSALYSREQHDRFVANVSTTSDPEVDAYQWLFIDFDPERPAGISSTDAELDAAKQLKDKVKEYLTGAGFPAPVEALSGNGYHLFYRIDLSATDESTKLVSNCLNALAAMFNTLSVKVDTTNCNPSRICKLHGTLAQKGSDTPERPHRMSRILVQPEAIEIVQRELLEKLAAELPEQPEPKRMTPRSGTAKPAFDLREFLARNGLTYKEDIGRDCQMFLLDECPFDHNHRNGDAKIFAYTDGAISFKCHHNSCKGKRWQDVRLLYEPGAYDYLLDDARIESGYAQHKKNRVAQQSIPDIPLPGDPAQEQQERPKKKQKQLRPLISAEELMQEHYDPPRVFIGIGVEDPLLVEGTSLLSAKPKLGKSWFSLGALIALALGEDFLGYKTQKCSVLYLDLETSKQLIQQRLLKALNGRPVPKNFYIETEADTLDNGFVEQIEHYLELDPDIGVVVIDVFQIIRSRAINSKEQEYEHAYRDITPLNKLAQERHIAIILVCHDRKAVDPDDPFSNILGSTGLQGAATQMIVMYRRRKTDPIHISIKGKTIDALPELDVKLENGQWSRVDPASVKDAELIELETEFKQSNIRQAVNMIAEYGSWKGKCSAMIEWAGELGMPYFSAEVTPKLVGAFLNKHKARFLKFDQIQVDVIKNGEAGKLYKIYKVPLMTVDTVDGQEDIPLPGWENADKINDFEIPFL